MGHVYERVISCRASRRLGRSLADSWSVGVRVSADSSMGYIITIIHSLAIRPHTGV